MEAWVLLREVSIYLCVVFGGFFLSFLAEKWLTSRGGRLAKHRLALLEIIRNLNHTVCGIALAFVPLLFYAEFTGVVVGSAVLTFLYVGARLKKTEKMHGIQEGHPLSPVRSDNLLASRNSTSSAFHLGFLAIRPGAAPYALGLVLLSPWISWLGPKFSVAYLILAFADPAAHHFGKRFPLFPLLGKSLGGFCAHTLITLLVFVCARQLLQGFGNLELVTCLVIALGVSAVEVISGKGWDNFTVPLSSAVALMIVS